MKPNLTFNHICSRILIFFFFFFFSNGASGRTITVVNGNGFTIWPAISGSHVLNITGFKLPEGNSRSFQTPANWSGIVWGRTGCTFNGSGHGRCKIGDCGSGEMDCNGRSPASPATVAGFYLTVDGTDVYNVSVSSGYNLQMTVEATSRLANLSRDCLRAGCVYDLNKRCPPELRLKGGGGCNTACEIFGTADYCCYLRNVSGVCQPTTYTQLFDSACPRSYTTCFDGNYTVRFGPASDTFSKIGGGNQLDYSNQLISSTGSFTLGFFGAYLGIWDTGDAAKAQKVWVANPNNPIYSTSDIITLSINQNTGDLIITAREKALMKLTDIQAGPNAANVTATLEDTGNFRLINEINKKVLWQSFDHPTKVVSPSVDKPNNSSTSENNPNNSSRSENNPNNPSRKLNILWALVVVPLFLGLGLLLYMKKRKRKQKQKEYEKKKRDESFIELAVSESFNEIHQLESDGRYGDLLLFSFASIRAATYDFSEENKLGQGGFGPVYKGRLEDGREIAIKRLSRSSGQGLVEFKNELILIAKLQHTNLVRILGCCIHKEEKMLVYEYMPNKSLDFFLFDEDRKAELDWPKRLNIIEGIAQGLLYLHKYSRMRVIHRDLKSNNILLDESMNPKISDFGMARIFNQNETQATTKRVVGTYGYMSPEYAMEGTFSIKSDIYSFGVLILETISGKRNSSFVHLDRTYNLLGYAWELWHQGNAMELEDPTLGSTCVEQQFLRTFHVALLCVQNDAVDRPTTIDMMSMLLNDKMPLPAPKRPAFFTHIAEANSSSDQIKTEDCSLNETTMSAIEGR